MAQLTQRQALMGRERMTDVDTAIQQLQADLQRRHSAGHTVESDTLDLRLFFAVIAQPLETMAFRDVERFLEPQHQQGLAPTTVNRRRHALTHFFDFLVEQRLVAGNPVKPSPFARLGRPLPRGLSTAQLQALFAQIRHPMDTALFLVMRRCGLRVAAVAQLTVEQIDWEQQALPIVQGKGRKDRRVSLSPDALASLRACCAIRPPGGPEASVFWNRKRPTARLSIKAIQKTMARYAKAAGVTASCHSLRHTFASNLLEHGAEIVTMKEFLGHASMTSSER
jgi:site-specific recombinase XerD